MPLWVGYLLHEDIHRILRKRGVPYMAEVNLTPWMPKGWGGTSDIWLWDQEQAAFVLTDVKSSKGEGMKYLVKNGPKIEHVKQTSVYWHAGKKMGIPVAKKIGIFYLPKNDTSKKDEVIEPLLLDFEPIPARELAKEMKDRHQAVTEYLKSLPKPNPRPLLPEEFVTDALAPVQERGQKVYYDRHTDTFELKLVPHWSTQFCPFPDELCSCRTQGTTKLGIFDWNGEYFPREGFEEIEPLVHPERY